MKIFFEFDVDTDKVLLDEYTKQCEFVFHLAGVNRQKMKRSLWKEILGFTSELLHLKKHNNKASVLITSSIQAERDNPYGRSKRQQRI